MTISQNIQYDQHFCIDPNLIQAIVKAAQLQKEDVILEIGPGKGILTRELAQKVKKVIAVEIDQELKPFLKDLPPKVEVIWENVINFLLTRKDFNKIVSNLPYQICEPLLQYLCTAEQVERAVLTVPKHFAQAAQKHPIFSAWLKIKIIQEVPPSAFNPPPKVKSALTVITRNKKENDALFLVRQLSRQRHKKVKNALRESLIDLYQKKHQKACSKKQVEIIMQQFHLPEKIKEGLIARLPLKFYSEISKNIERMKI